MHLALIVSFYNNADSINKCLKSVISFKKKLTKFDIKIILVDDGSTDETPSILTKFCSKLPSIELKKFEKNQGVSRSRNYGISKSLDSDYILFLDGDDEIDINFSEYLNKNRLINDLYAFDFSIIEKGKETKCSHLNTRKIFDDKSLSKYFFNYLTTPNKNSMFVTCWAKLFKTKILNDFKKLRFKEDMKIYEDAQFLFSFIRKSKKIEYIDISSYKYNKPDKVLLDQASFGGKWNVIQLFSFVSALRQLRLYLIEKKQNIDLVNSKILHCIGAYTCISSVRAWLRVKSLSDFLKTFLELKKIYKKPIIEKGLTTYNVKIANGNKLISFFLKHKYFFIASILNFIQSYKRYK